MSTIIVITVPADRLSQHEFLTHWGRDKIDAIS